MTTFWQEIRYASRALRKSPSFALIVVLTLGFGIGANAAIFSLMDQVLLRLLPVREPGQLVLLDGPGPYQGRTFNNMTFSYPMYADFRDRNEVFSGVLARFPSAMTAVWQGRAERASGDLVSGNYFEVLGVQPAIGRVLNAADDRTPGAHPVVVLSYGYWQRRFGGDPSVLNQTLVVNGHPLTIVGVTAPGFNGIQVGAASDIMVPLMMKAQMTPTWNDLDNRRSRWLTVMGRLKPGVTAEQAETQLNVVYKQINEMEVQSIPNASATFRQRFVAKHLEVLPAGRGLSDMRTQFSTPLVVLMCMVGVVLLVACANVANLMLARSTTRQREIALRLALGAGRGRIVRQQLVESLLLAFAGAMVGLAFATWTGRFLLAALPGDPTAQTLSATPDIRVVAFTLALSVITALVFGIAPALAATRPAVTAALKEESGSVAGGGRQARARRALVAAQVALSMMLLAGAGLFARSLFNLRGVDTGFPIDNLLTFSLDPSLSGYTQERSLALFDQVQQALAGVTGVRSVSMSEIGAFTGNVWGMTVKVDGYQQKEDENMNPNVDGIGPDYFAALGVPLVAGREFTERDTAAAPKVAIINETMAKYFFADRNPIGRRFGFGRGSATDIEIVGVVNDIRTTQMNEKPPRFVYIPYRQDQSVTQLTYVVRIAGDSAAAASSVRQAVQRIDPNLPIFDMKAMAAQVSESLYVQRMVAALSVAFGALATLLAAIGLYGVMSYVVARRTREIGIRMALGAERGGVLWLVLKEVAILAIAGVAIGLAGAFYLTKRIESQLFGLSPHDPLTLAAAVAVLVAVAFLAGLVPARRATAIDPLIALRTE
ncbi:MAG TPA: ABC transporter permease [Vicinamibacterales bacterium]|nr:ABC transporter permease [Vicinamibacterales bacterium]